VWKSGRINPLAEFGNHAGSVLMRKSNMIKKLLGAAGAAVVLCAVAVVPASAAKMMAGCSGPNLAKTESSIEAMADGEAKWAGYKEITAAQTAMLDGHMGACAAHLTRAMHVGEMK
jgi:hypothetical protein